MQESMDIYRAEIEHEASGNVRLKERKQGMIRSETRGARGGRLATKFMT